MNRTAIIAGLALVALTTEMFYVPYSERHRSEQQTQQQQSRTVCDEPVYFEYDLDDEDTQDESEEVLVMDEDTIKSPRLKQVRSTVPAQLIKKNPVWHCRTHIVIPGPEAVEKCGYENS